METQTHGQRLRFRVLLFKRGETSGPFLAAGADWAVADSEGHPMEAEKRHIPVEQIKVAA
jgi:hypothetical protein